MYRAPHAWLYVHGADAQGRPQRYGAEWASPSRLERDGVARDTFQAGDQVSITGVAGTRRDARQIHLKKVTRFTRGGGAGTAAGADAAGAPRYLRPCSFLNTGQAAFIFRNSSSDSQRRNGLVARSSAIVELGLTP